MEYASQKGAHVNRTCLLEVHALKGTRTLDEKGEPTDPKRKHAVCIERLKTASLYETIVHPCQVLIVSRTCHRASSQWERTLLSHCSSGLNTPPSVSPIIVVVLCPFVRPSHLNRRVKKHVNNKLQVHNNE